MLKSFFKKRIFPAFLCMTVSAACCACLTGCDGNKGGNSVSKPYNNFDAPVDGEDIIVLNIEGKGAIKIKLFEELAPKGSQNFRELVSRGYYDGLIFHRVIPEFMIQGGDPLGNGTGGASIWGDKFDGGIAPTLRHFTGAVAYANSGSTATNGSQFYIVVDSPQTDESLTQIGSRYGITFPKEVREKYIEVGGAPFLDGNYTVFGQVIEGLEIAESISKVSTGAQDKPKKDVKIESAVIETYKAD